MATVLEQQTVLPPAASGGDVNGLLELFAALQHVPRGDARLIGPDGTEVAMPTEVYDVLAKVVQALAQGKAIGLMPLNSVLTTQQAADMLNISRPTLVKLLEDGKIPFEKPGRHRRVLLADLIEYQERGRTRRRALLDEMTRAAEMDGSADKGDEFVQTR